MFTFAKHELESGAIVWGLLISNRKELNDYLKSTSFGVLLREGMESLIADEDIIRVNSKGGYCSLKCFINQHVGVEINRIKKDSPVFPIELRTIISDYKDR